MKKEKLIYESPWVETLEIEAEQVFAGSTELGNEYLEGSEGSWY